jgi:epoxyqueuosine reductase
MDSSSVNTLSELIKQKTYELGFDLCGIAPSRALKERGEILREWCASGMNSEMNYLARNIEKRIDPEYLVQGAKSVIVTGLNYYTDNNQEEPDVPILSRYAFGRNYHDVLTEKLEIVMKFIKSSRPGTECRSFVDSEPLLEKAWAVEAGLGWQGRHSVVINNKLGSFFFIGIVVLNIELDYDKPFAGNRCGSCRLCIDLCPTGAINEDGTVDARKCIANLTIENRGPIPENIIPKIGGRVYGCDRCQEVCPWNINAKPHKTPDFNLPSEVKHMTTEDWLNLTMEQFNRLFKDTPVERRKYEPFMRNVAVVTKRNN